MFGIGATEMVLILVVALLVFGPKRLPDLARSLGKGMAEFRRASNDLRHTLQEAEREADLSHDPVKNRIRPPEPPSENEEKADAVDEKPDTADEKAPAEKEGTQRGG